MVEMILRKNKTFSVFCQSLTDYFLSHPHPTVPTPTSFFLRLFSSPHSLRDPQQQMQDWEFFLVPVCMNSQWELLPNS